MNTPADSIQCTGFNQNLCINRGLNQEECFVGRVLHPPSGRMLEIYSNQYGVNLSTANEFGSGIVKSMQEIRSETIEQNRSENTMKLLNTIHQRMSQYLKTDETNDFKELKNVIMKIRCMEKRVPPTETPSNTPMNPTELTTRVADFVFTPMQVSYLKSIKEVIESEGFEEECEWLKSTVDKILKYGIVCDGNTRFSSSEYANRRNSSTTESSLYSKKTNKENRIPSYYKSTNCIVGKGRKIYRMHGGIAIQTQNYPSCESFRNFPNCVLNPNENYRHTITYKFWIRAGNPNRWIKRNLNESLSKGTKV